ncbi:MAG TPA: carbohydrate kinase family protein [Longimicrobiales bacterium]|nr:carbohydrate kinase family protein [Longimicrobiales bacterium]
MKRLGVIGTLVWDRIHARDERSEPVEEWGGIAYALEALAGVPPRGWQVVPIIKVGRDLAERAGQFLSSLPGLDVDTGIRIVPEPNNRVELRYQDQERRCEHMSGGVPPWTWPELEPIVHRVDALYVNFISGFELTLDVAAQLRLSFDGPIYADLHSLFLGVGPGGLRTPQPLVAWREWLRCFDIVQVNESELESLANAWGDPWLFAAEVVDGDLRLLLVTLGPRGAAYVASPAFLPDPLSWRAGGPFERPIAVSGPSRSEHVPLERDYDAVDPTGCGDVWGSTVFARLLEGAQLVDAMRAANDAAARNSMHRGATGLHKYLQGRLGP